MGMYSFMVLRTIKTSSNSSKVLQIILFNGFLITVFAHYEFARCLLLSFGMHICVVLYRWHLFIEKDFSLRRLILARKVHALRFLFFNLILITKEI